MKHALGPEKSASVLSRILPSSSSKGLEILAWMTPQNIFEMIGDEHPQVIAIIMSVLEEDTAAELLALLPSEMRTEVMRRVALLDTVQPSAMSELEDVVQGNYKARSLLNNTYRGGYALRPRYEPNETGFGNRGLQRT